MQVWFVKGHKAEAMSPVSGFSARDPGPHLSFRAGAEQVQGGPGRALGGGRLSALEPSCVGKLLAASWLSYSQPLSFYGAGSKRMLLGWLWEVFKWSCREQQENTAARVGVAALNTTL